MFARVVVMTFCAALLGLLGCGGGATRTVTSASLPARTFEDRVEAICARGRLQGLRYEPSLAKGRAEVDAVAKGIEEILLPALSEVAESIYHLRAPASEKRRPEGFLIALLSGIDAAHEVDPPTLERMEQLLEPSAAIARKLGLGACAFG